VKIEHKSLHVVVVIFVVNVISFHHTSVIQVFKIGAHQNNPRKRYFSQIFPRSLENVNFDHTSWRRVDHSISKEAIFDFRIDDLDVRRCVRMSSVLDSKVVAYPLDVVILHVDQTVIVFEHVPD
jgi:hypothetical protein